VSVEVAVLETPSIESLSFEVVERKGIGHPDTLCDAIAERASRYYAAHCLAQFGRVAHHWFDKVMLIGGEAVIEYGRGTIIEPYQVVFAGKAAFRVGTEIIPVSDILAQAAQDVLREILWRFDTSRHLRVTSKITDAQGPGRSAARYRPATVDDLVDWNEPDRVSNDGNVCVGYAPLSRLEQAVLDAEAYLVSREFKLVNKDTGADIKVFGKRWRDHFALTITIPFIADLVPSWETYSRRADEIEADVCGYLCRTRGYPLAVAVNPARRYGLTYMTATGTVADTGDVGAVGRGNRINGLITPMRPMSIEASAGKNPTDHTGKLYSLLARDLSTLLATKNGTDVVVTIVTAKERPLNDPEHALVQLRDTGSIDWEAVRGCAEQALADVGQLSRQFIVQPTLLW
jgi:S-adenosylmethionine synthetase